MTKVSLRAIHIEIIFFSFPLVKMISSNVQLIGVSLKSDLPFPSYSENANGKLFN